MNIKTLTQLDYFRVKKAVSAFCVSEDGKRSFSDKLPLTRKADMEKYKTRSMEWTRLINAGTDPVLSGWPSLEHIFPLLLIPNAALSLEQLYELGLFCKSVQGIKKGLSVAASEKGFARCTQKNMLSNTQSLCDLSLSLPDLNQAQICIFSIVDPSGKLKDLKELQAIRTSIRAIRRNIETLIKNYTGDSRFQPLLQSNIPVLRADRQVLAVKASYKTKIKGIVHEVSQTGQTVYIEPADVVLKNNELVQQEFRLEQEIRRILASASRELSRFTSDFEKALDIMVEFDISKAAALWGIENHCTFAENTDNEHPLVILQARHPLLSEKAVPIDMEFSKDARVLIVTGANTGGKTVAIKTLALFTLLNQSGIPLPAAQGTRLPFFSSFFADIGDEQDIDESLSTFSAHMKNIGEMLEKADENSLVVLDELGNGTDPQEGAAIAMAVLDDLIDKKAFVLVTTHHSSLKNYGYTHNRCINASVEFNEKTLRPTYRIRMGIPGESRALSIAEKSGIAPSIIGRAKQYTENHLTDISSLIEGLSKKYAELECTQSECRARERLLSNKELKLELKSKSLKQKEIELRKSGLKELSCFLDENRKMLENLVRELRESEISREKTLKVKQFIGKIEKTVENERQKLKKQHSALESEKCAKKETRQNSSRDGKDLCVGMEVFLGSSKTRAVIIGEAKKGGWLVQTGSVKINCRTADLSPAVQRSSHTSNAFNPSKNSGTKFSFSVELDSAGTDTAKTDTAVFELRLLGMHLEEALKALNRQLDLCAIQGVHEFSIIHGKGNGVLQEGVHHLLSSCTSVKNFAFAPPQDGGTGKTYVYLG